MELKSRLAAILKELLETQSGLSLDDVSSRYNITKRTLYYDIEIINDWLKENSFGSLKVANQQLYLISTKSCEIYKQIDKSPYYYSVEERKIIELFYIALSSKIVNIKDFTCFFGVSKNTIINDIRELKDSLEEGGISLISNQKQGYILNGEEFAIRKEIGQYFSKIKSHHPSEEIKRFLQRNLIDLTEKNYDYYEIARCLIKQYEIDINSQLYTGYIDYECTMILISWIRALKGNNFVVNTDEKDTLNITKSYASIVKNSDKLRFHGLLIPSSEVYYMTTLLLGIRTAQFSSQEQETLFIYRYVDELIKNFEIIACMQIREKEKLAIRLRSHIRPFYYRLKYGVQEEGILTNNIQSMYSEAFEFCKRALYEIDSDLSKLMSIDEIAYLTIYFSSLYDTQYSFSIDLFDAHKILVVSENGRAESDWIIEQLKTTLGGSFNYEAAQYNKLKNIDFECYSLIISTIPIKKELANLKNKVVIVNTLIDEKSFIQIISKLSQQGISYKDDMLIRKLIEDVSKNVTGKINNNKLYLDFFKTINSISKIDKENQYDEFIMKMIESKKFKYFSSDSSWELIILEGYKNIYKENEAMLLLQNIETIEKQKEYLYNITKNIILVYCYNFQPIVEDKVSIVISRNEIAVSEKNRGNIFIFFGCQNDTKHFKHLKGIYNYFESLSITDVKKLIYEGGL